MKLLIGINKFCYFNHSTLRLESDVSKLLKLIMSSPNGEFEENAVQNLLQNLSANYKINMQKVDFTQNYPDYKDFFKVVAVVGDRLYSIFDGRTEYKLGLQAQFTRKRLGGHTNKKENI